MIIKELRIDSFGVISKKVISFHKGLNVVYGENEKGKSTIEAFIKIMLYGFINKKINGEIERKRYMSFRGSSIGGELLLEYNNKNYIIKRTFGINKKEDSSIIMDALTGDEAININKEEPGKSFLGINRSTYEKTLFVNQLGVIVSKDKEEEIMDKITTILSCSEEEVPIAKAIDRLESIKKTLITIRGVGELDLLKKKEQRLLEEAYEANKICENNLKWEEELYKEKNNRRILEEDISNLEIYKKYIKKLSLQKEYKEIAEYLKKSQELKKKEEEIISNISNGNEIIDESFINSLKEENIQYCNLLKHKEEAELNKDKVYKEINYLKESLREYKFVEDYSNDINNELLEKKYEQRLLVEKINTIQKTILEINNLEHNLENEKKKIGTLINLESHKEEVENTFNEYEKRLYEMKFLAENNKTENNSNLVIIKVISIITFILGVIGIFLNTPLKIIGGLLIIVSVIVFYKIAEKTKKEKQSEGSLKRLTDEINLIEFDLNRFVKEIGVKDYRELLNSIKKYNSYKEIEDKIKISISEKRKSLSEDDYNKAVNKYNKNKQFINKIITKFNCKNIDEVIEKLKEYYQIKNNINSLELNLEEKIKSLKILLETINEKEISIKGKLKVINLENINLQYLDKYIEEYSNKINKYKEIHNNFLRIEDTYKVLLKDRNIEKIKEDLNQIVNKEDIYSFSTEEEVEQEEKIKSKELLECEKKIKDLENSINNRLIGKRNLITIEEELELVKEEINKGNKKVKALELALRVLIESLDEVKKDIGPEINKRIGENFKILTENKYGEVLLGDKYDMVVRDESNIFKASFLSNGALDQLYLSLRIAFIQLLFCEEDTSVILDDALIQYDDIRRRKALLLLKEKIKGQVIIFTCQNTEMEILNKEGINFNYIALT